MYHERIRWLMVALAERPLFWAAILGAVLLKHLTVRSIGIWSLISTTISAILCAVLFSGFVMEWFSLSPKSEPAVAALLAIFGDHGLRLVLQSQSLADLIRAWRGK